MYQKSVSKFADNVPTDDPLAALPTPPSSGEARSSSNRYSRHFHHRQLGRKESSFSMKAGSGGSDNKASPTIRKSRSSFSLSHHPFGIQSEDEEDDDSSRYSNNHSRNSHYYSDDEGGGGDPVDVAASAPLKGRGNAASNGAKDRVRREEGLRRATSLSPGSLGKKAAAAARRKGGDSHRSNYSSRSDASNASNVSTASNFSLGTNSTGSTLAFPRGDSSSLLSPTTTSTPSPVGDDRAAGSSSAPGMVAAFDSFLAGPVREFVSLSKSLGPKDLFEQARVVEDLLTVQREFLLSSCTNRTPSAGTGPTQAAKIREVRSVAERHRDSQNYPHLRFISETVGAVGWIVVGKKPHAFIRESYEGGKKFVKEIKKVGGKSSQPSLHSQWVKSWQEVILDLEAFVRQWHPYGLIWGRTSK